MNVLYLKTLIIIYRFDIWYQIFIFNSRNNASLFSKNKIYVFNSGKGIIIRILLKYWKRSVRKAMTWRVSQNQILRIYLLNAIVSKGTFYFRDISTFFILVLFSVTFYKHCLGKKLCKIKIGVETNFTRKFWSICYKYLQKC